MAEQRKCMFVLPAFVLEKWSVLSNFSFEMTEHRISGVCFSVSSGIIIRRKFRPISVWLLGVHFLLFHARFQHDVNKL